MLNRTFSKFKRLYGTLHINQPKGALSFVKPVGFAVGVTVTSYFVCKQLHIWRETPEFCNKCNARKQSASVTVGNEIIFAFLATNALVFGAWSVAANPKGKFRTIAQSRNLYAFMFQNFTHSPMFGNLRTLLLSNYSHKELWHLLANMVTFWSFGSSVVHYLSFNELQRRYSIFAPAASSSDALIGNSGYELLFLIVSAGVFSSLTSHLVANFSLLAKLTRSLPKGAANASKGRPWRNYTGSSSQYVALDSIPASLGASGIVWGIVGYVATVNPSQRANIFFLPISFEMGYLVPFILSSEFIAYYVFKYRTFDVAAHLGGAIYGYLYAKFIRPNMMKRNL